MQLPQAGVDNQRFLVAEIVSQLDSLQRFIKFGKLTDAQKVRDRSGYSHNLMRRVISSCQNISNNSALEHAELMRLRALESVAIELDMISKLSRESINGFGNHRCRK